MTTLDGVERIFDDDAGAGLRPQRALRRSPGSWAARSPRSRRRPPRVLLEVATWNGVNILRTSRKLGLRTDASQPLREAAPPGAGAARRSGSPRS